jgi:hypothetical protein
MNMLVSRFLPIKLTDRICERKSDKAMERVPTCLDLPSPEVVVPTLWQCHLKPASHRNMMIDRITERHRSVQPAVPLLFRSIRLLDMRD